jgi:hypothetical protein
LCASCSPAPLPPALQKKRKKKSCWHYTCCLYNNIVVTSSVSNCKKKLFDREISIPLWENKNKKNLKKNMNSGLM